MMNADVIGDPTLRNRNQRAAHDGHDHHPRSISCKRTKFCDAERKDAGKHDGVEEADQDDAVHGGMSTG